MSRKKDKSATTPDKEMWTTIQVAAFLGVSYASARHRMLVGDFGKADYDAEKRKLSVSADRVRATKPDPTPSAKKRR